MNAKDCVAWNLRAIRVLRGISQENLAVDAQIDRSYVSRLERGLENPTVNILEKLAISLNIHIQYFFSHPESHTPPPALPSGRKPSKNKTKTVNKPGNP